MKKFLLIALLITVSACSTLQEGVKSLVKQPEVTYKSISVGEVSMDAFELNPTFSIENKNTFSLPIDSVTYDLSLNEKNMLTGETKDIGTLPANNTKDVTLSLGLTQETLTALQQLLFKNKQLDYTIKGSVKTMGLAIPFEKSATLYVPEIKVADVQVKEASFSQLDILLSIDVDNKNDFGLPLDTLNYSVSSKGKHLFKGDINNQEIAKGKTNIQLPLSIKPSDLFTSVLGLLADPELPLHFEIQSPLFSKSYDQSLNLLTFF